MIRILKGEDLVTTIWGKQHDSLYQWVSWKELTEDEKKQVNVERKLSGMDPILDDRDTLYAAIQLIA